jgi:hypothetical protein
MPDNPIRRRNPVARSPLLRKGGVHRRYRSSERRQQNAELRDLLEEWENGENTDNSSIKRRPPRNQ